VWPPSPDLLNMVRGPSHLLCVWGTRGRRLASGTQFKMGQRARSFFLLRLRRNHVLVWLIRYGVRCAGGRQRQAAAGAAGIAPISLGGVVKLLRGFGMQKEHPPTPDIQVKSSACDSDLPFFLLILKEFKDL
jgi:hypothetical protein